MRNWSFILIALNFFNSFLDGYTVQSHASDKGWRIECMVCNALAIMHDHGDIAGYFHSPIGSIHDRRGIDVEIHLKSGVIIPLQCKADIYDVGRHLFRYPHVPYVLVMEKYSREKVLEWRRTTHAFALFAERHPGVLRPCVAVVEQAVPAQWYCLLRAHPDGEALNRKYVSVLDETIAELCWLVVVAETEIRDFGATSRER